jgi:hypothetical protein
LRCGRPRYNCGRSSFLWVTCAVGPCRPALHSRGCTVRKLDAAIALRLVPRGRRPVAPCSCLHTHAGRGHGPASWSIGRAVTARARLAMHRCTVASAQHTKEDAGAVELAYNPYFSTYFFNYNNIFSKKIQLNQGFSLFSSQANRVVRGPPSAPHDSTVASP